MNRNKFIVNLGPPQKYWTSLNFAEISWLLPLQLKPFCVKKKYEKKRRAKKYSHVTIRDSTKYIDSEKLSFDVSYVVHWMKAYHVTSRLLLPFDFSLNYIYFDNTVFMLSWKG